MRLIRPLEGRITVVEVIDDYAVASELIDDEEEKEPVRKRFIVNDSTVEKLGVLLNENPNGLLCFRDELVGLLTSLDREGQESARSFCLEAWNATGRFTYDRIGRGTLDIDACCVNPKIHGLVREGTDKTDKSPLT